MSFHRQKKIHHEKLDFVDLFKVPFDAISKRHNFMTCTKTKYMLQQLYMFVAIDKVVWAIN